MCVYIFVFATLSISQLFCSLGQHINVHFSFVCLLPEILRLLIHCDTLTTLQTCNRPIIYPTIPASRSFKCLISPSDVEITVDMAVIVR